MKNKFCLFVQPKSLTVTQKHAALHSLSHLKLSIYRGQNRTVFTKNKVKQLLVKQEIVPFPPGNL
jgi:hypothetical protein